MQINFDENCSSSDKITKELVQKTLDFVDNSVSKRKDTVKESLKKYDSSLVVIFEKMIERKAIVTYSEKKNGHNRTFLETANRNLVFYSIKKMTEEVPSKEYMKKAFTEAWLNGKIQVPKNCTKFDYLRSEADPFEKFLSLPFGDFYILASYCFCEYDRLIQQKESEKRVPNIKYPHFTSKSNEDDSLLKCLSELNVENKEVKTDSKKEKSDNRNDIKVETVVESENKKESIDLAENEIESANEIENKKEPIDLAENGNKPATDHMESKKEDKNSLSNKTEFEKYRCKREEVRNSMLSEINDINKLYDINSYIKYSFIELKRLLDPSLFRDNQYSNMKYSNKDVFECGFDNVNVLLTKLSFDFSSLEKMKKIIDNAIESIDLYKEAKSNLDHKITESEKKIAIEFAK